MIKQAPSFGRIFAMVAFALSCFGILVFLWLSFGGSVPLQPEGYRVSVAFPEATQLAQEADVRISGVRVGRVKKSKADEISGLTEAELEIDARYAPIAKDAQAILRQKTLLGETYVELSPGTKASGSIADGGRLPNGHVSDTVQFDEILRGFPPETRRRFSVWLDQQGRAVADHGAEINAALANLTPFAEETDEVLDVLRRQSRFTRGFIRDTGVVFDALTERQGQLRDLVVNSNRLWETTARRDAELADTFRVLPTFLREGRETTRRLTRFANNTNPLVTQLRPAARELSPTLADLERLAPDLRGFFVDLDPLVKVARTGLPATERVLDNTRPVLARLDPFLRQLTPIVDYLGLYRREITAFFANDSAATQATGTDFAGSGALHYLRVTNPTNPEMLAAYPYRIGSNRSNPYTEPGGYDKLRTEGHLEVFGSYLCTDNPVPAPPAPSSPYLPPDLVDLIKRFVYGGPENAGARPPCDPQAPLGRLLGQAGAFPHLQPLAE
ncbi:MAG TPA: MlaD family protein [Thermoleophilaceae bacterium]|nr:MlaD family protein [Thermoleophilaceae bacterium]